jgi:competence protein ComEC
MALHFEQVSLAALPANLLAAAAIAPVMWLGMLAAAAAQVGPALALPFNALNAPLLAFVEWVAHTFAAAPAAAVPVRLGSPAALAGVYAALVAAILGVVAAWRRMTALEVRGRAVAAIVAVALTGLGCAAALEAGSVGPPAPGELVVSFLDVGQGDATLLQKDGVAVLVDTGPPGGPILKRLSEAGVERLDALVITHAQADHEGAALEVLRRHPTRLVVNGGAGWPTRVQAASRPPPAPAGSPPTPGRRSRSAGSACGCCGRRRPAPASAPRATPINGPSWRSCSPAPSTSCSPPTPNPT